MYKFTGNSKKIITEVIRESKPKRDNGPKNNQYAVNFLDFDCDLKIGYIRGFLVQLTALSDFTNQLPLVSAFQNGIATYNSLTSTVDLHGGHNASSKNLCMMYLFESPRPCTSQ